MNAFPAGDPASVAPIENALAKYSDLIGPWAEAAGRTMVTEVSARDLKTWKAISAEMGGLLRKEIATAPTGIAMRAALDRQTALIKSLPTEAAQRVRKLTLEGITGGVRASEIAAEIMKTGEVTQARANLIARTEVGRTATELTKARAESVGSTEFIWRTAGDGAVRPSHKRLNGKTFRWDSPPECDPGIFALPGCSPNCRCIPEPIIPED